MLSSSKPLSQKVLFWNFNRGSGWSHALHAREEMHDLERCNVVDHHCHVLPRVICVLKPWKHCRCRFLKHVTLQIIVMHPIIFFSCQKCDLSYLIFKNMGIHFCDYASPKWRRLILETWNFIYVTIFCSSIGTLSLQYVNLSP